MRFLLLALAFSIFGCTTITTVTSGAMSAAVDKLTKGDRASVRTAAGWYEDLKVVDVDATSLRVERAGEPLIFARDEILEIQTRRAAPGKTAALAAAVYFLSLYALCGNPFHETGGC